MINTTIEIEIRASDCVRRTCETVEELAEILETAHGRCSVTVDGAEIYNGPVPPWDAELWRNEIDFQM